MSTLAEETRLLRQLASKVGAEGFRWTRHAEQRMAERRVPKPAVVSCVQRGAVIDRQDGDKRKVQGRLPDGRILEVVVVPKDDRMIIIVITVIAR